MMKQAGGGSIVLCSSVAARRGLVNHEAIAAAKAGVEGLALAAAASYARFGVRVNCVAPGLTRTEMTRSLTQNETVAKIPPRCIRSDASASRTKSPRPSAGCWIASKAGCTGQVIGVDGRPRPRSGAELKIVAANSNNKTSASAGGLRLGLCCQFLEAADQISRHHRQRHAAACPPRATFSFCRTLFRQRRRLAGGSAILCIPRHWFLSHPHADHARQDASRPLAIAWKNCRARTKSWRVPPLR